MATTSALGGGATSTTSGTSITLTSSSNRVQYINMTAASLSVTLPDATTLSTGGPIFVIINVGAYAFNIKDSSGSTLMQLSAASSSNSVSFFLVSNSTAAGKWVTEDRSFAYTFGSTATVTSNLLTSAYNGYKYFGGVSAQGLTSTTALVTWQQGTAGRDIYGAVLSVSSGTITVGTETLLYSGSSTAATTHEAHALSSTAGFIYVGRASNMVAVPFTISGTSITVGTASSTFSAAHITGGSYGSGTQFGAYCTISSTVGLISYRTNATSVYTYVVNTITHNGTSAPTLGTASSSFNSLGYSGAVSLSPLTATTYFLSYVNGTSAGQNDSRVVTTSGTSAPTLGTAVTVTATLGSGNNYFFTGYSTSSTSAVIWSSYRSVPFTISGTTVTAGTTSFYVTPPNSNYSSRPTIIDATNMIGFQSVREANTIQVIQLLSNGVNQLSPNTNNPLPLSVAYEPNDNVGTLEFVRLSDTLAIVLTNNYVTTASASSLYAIALNLTV
jgi:hypothetical protein